MTEVQKIFTKAGSTEYEMKTRELFATIDWSCSAQIVANIFIAFPTSVFSQEALETLAKTLYHLQSADLTAVLKMLVRKKVLRRNPRNKGYEVAY